MPRRRGVYGMLLFLLLTPTFRQGFAQGNGQIGGTIKDSSGGVIPGADVQVTNERTHAVRATVADGNGFFILPALPPSTYKVTASAPAFAPAELHDIHLATGDSLTVKLVLQPAGTSESIVVVATQEQSIDTSSARIGASVNEREVGSLPLNGRQLSQLYLQAPGSVNAGSGSFFDIRFSGRSNEQNAIRFDGVEGSSIIDASPGNLNGEISSPFRLQTSLESVQEFRVESNNYPAEYGTGTGGQISVNTKSGSNQLHGSLFEYTRNDVLDARNFFDRGSKSPLRLNQFGGSVGGPVVKDRVFFFGSYEGYRLRSGINLIEAVPSEAAAARAVPAIRPLLAAFRGPGSFILPGASSNPDFDIAQLQSGVAVNENSGAARFDFKLSQKHTLYTRYFRDQGTATQPEGVTGRRTTYRSVPQNGVISLQSTLSQRLINEFKFGYNGALTRVQGEAPAINGIDLSSITLNLTGSVANTGIAGQGASSGIAVPGGLIRGSSAFNGRAFPYTPYSLSFIDSLSMVRANHNAKIGVEVRAIRMYTDRLGRTTYSFSNLIEFLDNRALQIQYVGDLSEPSPFNGGAVGGRHVRQEYYIAWAQDEWRVRPYLTLNYGLRYEYYAPLREARNLAAVFDTVSGTMLPSNASYAKYLKTNFGPRVGIAWSPNSSGKGWFAGGKTVLRAGFGIYYGPGQTEDQIQPIESDRIQLTLSGGSYPIDPAVLRANFLNNPANRQYQPRAYSPDYRIPERIYQYSVSIQQELPYRMNLTAAYVGSQGRNLFLRSWSNKVVDVNTNPDPARPATVIREFDIVQPDGTVLRPYAEIDYKTSGGHDSYNALQVALGRRFATGVTLNSQYTLGRSFGNTSGSNDALTAGNPFNFDYDIGYNNFDVRHSFNLSAVYSLPFGAKTGSWGRMLLQGWDVGTIINVRSGLPIDVRVQRNDVVYVDAAGLVFNNPGAGRTAVINTPGGGASRNVRRPDLVAGANPYLDGDRQFLNPAAFAIPAPGTSGNLMRGTLHGPDFRQFDVVVNKRFRVTESSNIVLRAEFFNVFNLTNFVNPAATLPNALGTGTNQLQPGQPFTAAAAGNFGTMNSTVERTVGLGTNRQIQLALRLNW